MLITHQQSGLHTPQNDTDIVFRRFYEQMDSHLSRLLTKFYRKHRLQGTFHRFFEVSFLALPISCIKLMLIGLCGANTRRFSHSR
jgi:hypothetical protein